MPQWIRQRRIEGYGSNLELTNPDSYAKESDENNMSWLHSDQAINNMAAVASDLDVLKFIGGDVLLRPELHDHIAAFTTHARSSCRVQMSTMLSRWSGQLVSSLESLHACDMEVIIEGHGHVDEWLRYQSHWHVTTSMLDKLCQVPNVNITVYTNITAINLHSLPTLLEWLRNVCERNQRLITWTPMINTDPVLDPGHIPLDQRIDIADRLAAIKLSTERQWPLFCWDGIDRLDPLLRAAGQQDGKHAAMLRELLDYQQALRRNSMVRKWLGHGDDADWQEVFPALDACLPRAE